MITYILSIWKITGGEYRNRTDVHGFAIRCVTRAKARQNRHLDKFNPLRSQIGHKGDVKWEVFEKETVSSKRR